MNNLFKANTQTSNYAIHPNPRTIENEYLDMDTQEDRGSDKKKSKKKLNFKNTISSLNEVEYFLNNFTKMTKCIKFLKLFK